LTEDEQLEEFHKNVIWLHDNIPPDDIYLFAEQALFSAEYFILKWAEHVDLEKEAESNKTTELWLKNVLGIRALRKLEAKGMLDFDMKFLEDS